MAGLLFQSFSPLYLYFQDSNTNYELPVLHDFSDIYYMTREVTLTPAGSDPFSRTTPLPQIGGSSTGSAQVTNVFKKVKNANIIIS